MAVPLLSMPVFPEIALPFLTSSISSALGETPSCLAALPVSPLGAFQGMGAHPGGKVGHKDYAEPAQAPQGQNEAHSTPPTLYEIPG